MSDPAQPPDYFAPTFKRALFAAILAGLAFLLPQEIALEWYPLNEPGNDIHYLETTLRCNTTETMRFLYDCGFGIREPYTITIPLGPSDMAFTYTFPLPDGPLRKLLIDPVDGPGEIEFTRMRIINRREEEVRRFTKDDFKPGEGLQILPTDLGWKIVTTDKTPFVSTADTQFLRVMPKGMNIRNLKRCLLSWGYLSFMLWIITLAIYFTLLNHHRGKDILRAMAFLAFICMMFSAVGNRGLIKNSARLTGYTPPEIPAGHQLEIDLSVEKPISLQLTLESGLSPTPAKEFEITLEPTDKFQTARFSLPESTSLQSIKLTAPSGDGKIKMFSLRLVDGGRFTRDLIAASELQPLDGTKVERVETVSESSVILPGSPENKRVLELPTKHVQEITAALKLKHDEPRMGTNARE